MVNQYSRKCKGKGKVDEQRGSRDSEFSDDQTRKRNFECQPRRLGVGVQPASTRATSARRKSARPRTIEHQATSRKTITLGSSNTEGGCSDQPIAQEGVRLTGDTDPSRPIRKKATMVMEKDTEDYAVPDSNCPASKRACGAPPYDL